MHARTARVTSKDRYSLALPQARWTLAVNIRQSDKIILDSLMEIARDDRSDITKVVRGILTEYVKSYLASRGEATTGEAKIDRYLQSPSAVTKILTRDELAEWSDSDVLFLTKTLKSRMQELDCELRRRGYRFTW